MTVCDHNSIAIHRESRNIFTLCGGFLKNQLYVPDIRKGCREHEKPIKKETDEGLYPLLSVSFKDEIRNIISGFPKQPDVSSR